MPTLTLQFKDTNLSDYPLEKGMTLVIGRRETCTIVIDNLAVSGTHAKVDMLENGCLLTDLQSKNGTFVNGKMVTAHWLKPGDVVMIGKHTLIYKLAQGEAGQAEPQAGMDNKTMVLDTSNYRAMLDKNTATSPPQPQVAAPKKEPRGMLSFLKGGEGEVTLVKKLVKIGKDSSSDIVVGGFLTGQTAATISRRPNGYVLSFVEGMTKPRVNGTAVKDSVILREFDKIEIGGVLMEFIMKD